MLLLRDMMYLDYLLFAGVLDIIGGDIKGNIKGDIRSNPGGNWNRARRRRRRPPRDVAGKDLQRQWSTVLSLVTILSQC